MKIKYHETNTYYINWHNAKKKKREQKEKKKTKKMEGLEMK